MWHGEEGTLEHRTQRRATPFRHNPFSCFVTWSARHIQEVNPRSDQPAGAWQGSRGDLRCCTVCICMRYFIMWKETHGQLDQLWAGVRRPWCAATGWGTNSPSKGPIIWDILLQNRDPIKHCLLQNKSFFLSHIVSVPPYKGQAKKNTFYSCSKLVITEKQQILNCFAHTAKSVQEHIQRELKSSESFLSVFQLRNDQKSHQCAS